jgi:DHA2 family multidrug resistance protein
MSAGANPSTGLYGSDPALLSPIAARLLARGWLKWAIALSASFGAILEVIDVNITNVALPDIRGNLGATLSEAGWVSTAYACANVVIIPLSAWLGMRFGKKNYFVFSLAGFTIASVLCGLAPNLDVLIMARVLQGLAGGGLLAKAQSIVFEAFEVSERGAAQAIFGLGVIAGPAVGPVLGGWLTDTLGWRWIFFINIPFGILAAMACLTFLPADEPDKLDKGSKVDWTGIGLLAVGLATFQVMLEQGQEDDWFSSRFITSMGIISAVGIIAFVWWELTVKAPAVDLRVLRHRSMIGGSLYSAILGMGLYGIMFAIPVFVQDYLHYTAEQSGQLQVPGAIAAGLTMFAFGAVSNRFDPRVLIAIGAVLTTATGMLLTQLNPDSGVATIFWPLILRSIGSVMIFMPLSIAALGPLPKKDIAAGAGIYSLTRQLGSSIGIALITTMLVRREALHRSILVEKVSGFRTAAMTRIDALAAGFPNHTADPIAAKQHALGIIDRIVNGQAALQSYADIFSYVAIIFILSLPLLLLLGGKQGQKGREAAAEAH